MQKVLTCKEMKGSNVKHVVYFALRNARAALCTGRALKCCGRTYGSTLLIKNHATSRSLLNMCKIKSDIVNV
ncbi:hypothetical protein QL285_084830 [Trifolium repens]|nr:hypothetical protein QL285_084830 [Trifolium repens]